MADSKTMLVMARPRGQQEEPDFTSFRRSGISFPQWAPGQEHGSPVLVTLVEAGDVYPEDGEVTPEGWNAILLEPFLVVEANDAVRDSVAELAADAKRSRKDFSGAKIVSEGSFENLIDTTTEELIAEGDAKSPNYSRMKKAELLAACEAAGIEAEGMTNREMISALTAGAEE